jgi:hypothetical protein
MDPGIGARRGTSERRLGEEQDISGKPVFARRIGGLENM